MEHIAGNMQKYANYKEQMGRLKRALSHEFYLEAIFIEYAIIEDRLESALRHSGKWNYKSDSFVSLDKKLKGVSKMAEEKKNLAHRYFTAELTDSIGAWKNDRNRIIHALMKQDLHTNDLYEIAVRGRAIVRVLCNKTSLHNRALERMDEKRRNSNA